MREDQIIALLTPFLVGCEMIRFSDNIGVSRQSHVDCECLHDRRNSFAAWWPWVWTASKITG